MAVRRHVQTAGSGTLVRRTTYLVALMGFFALVLLARMSHLQLVRHSHYAGQAQANQVQPRRIAPRRGIILDRNGEILVANRASFRLILVAEQAEDAPGMLTRLEDQGFVKTERQGELMEALRLSPSFAPLAVRAMLPDEQAARFAVRRHQFAGVDIEGLLLREYPLGPSGAHALGYVAAVSAADKQRLDPSVYAGIPLIGKTGVEGSYEEDLRGSAGGERILMDAYGRPLERTSDLDPLPGGDLQLALDGELQREAFAAMESRRGAVVAVDPRDGGVLALVSSPAFDPNEFVSGMDSARFAELNRNPALPMFNRAVRGLYPPGSTIKPMLALVALAEGYRDPGQTIYCRGSYRLSANSRLFRDWKREGHGTLTIQDAIAESCDVYFYQLARDMDIEGIHEGLVRFGFGAASGIDIAGERPGIVPSRAWKRSAFSDPAQQPWFPGETVVTGIGQGSLVASPLQLAQATAQIAMRGMRYKPRLVEAIRDPVSGRLMRRAPESAGMVAPESAEHWLTVVDSMVAVLHGPKGTARATGAKLAYTAAGKTGTSQVVALPREGEADPGEIDERFRDHSLFVAFAPVHDPVIALAVIVENGGSGSGAAAAVAARVLDTYLASHSPPDQMAQAR